MKNSPRSRNNNSEPITPKSCHFCQHGVSHIDYKDIQLLRRFTSSYAKIIPRKRTGVCLAHQNKLSQAIKRARTMALLPFVPR